MKNYVTQLVDAITASGKKFADVSKDSIYAFLDREGVSKKNWESIYDELRQIYHPSTSKKEDRKHLSAVVDYTDSSHNDVKVRQPRKSVFSEITKIAG
jgi:hypothetical protein